MKTEQEKMEGKKEGNCWSKMRENWDVQRQENRGNEKRNCEEKNERGICRSERRGDIGGKGRRKTLKKEMMRLERKGENEEHGKGNCWKEGMKKKFGGN